MSFASVCLYIGKQCYFRRNGQELQPWPKLIIEIVILVVSPIPNYDKVFTFSEINNTSKVLEDGLTIQERNT